MKTLFKGKQKSRNSIKLSRFTRRRTNKSQVNTSNFIKNSKKQQKIA